MTQKRAELHALLQRKGAFELIKETAGPKQLRLMGRIDRSRQNFWLMLVFQLISSGEKPGCPWTCDISRVYIMHSGALRYVWRIIFASENLEACYADIIKTVASSPSPTRVEVEEQLLPGYKPGQTRGGVNAKGKGAHSALRPVVGRMAHQKYDQGGQ